MTETMIEVPTRHGPARLHLTGSAGQELQLVLTHGAGGGIDAPDLIWFAEHADDLGCQVIRVEMPWRVAGKKIAPRPAVLDECWLDLFADMSWRTAPRKLVTGGRSAGARVALRTAVAVHADGVLALAFPLHPPGKPERSRAAELQTAVPVVIVQGERDPFGRPEEFPENCDLVVQARAGHPLRGETTLREGLIRLLARL